LAAIPEGINIRAREKTGISRKIAPLFNMLPPLYIELKYRKIRYYSQMSRYTAI
jgi:hypothetical protein